MIVNLLLIGFIFLLLFILLIAGARQTQFWSLYYEVRHLLGRGVLTKQIKQNLMMICDDIDPEYNDLS